MFVFISFSVNSIGGAIENAHSETWKFIWEPCTRTLGISKKKTSALLQAEHAHRTHTIFLSISIKPHHMWGCRWSSLMIHQEWQIKWIEMQSHHIFLLQSHDNLHSLPPFFLPLREQLFHLQVPEAFATYFVLRYYVMFIYCSNIVERIIVFIFKTRTGSSYACHTEIENMCERFKAKIASVSVCLCMRVRARLLFCRTKNGDSSQIFICVLWSR